EIAIIANSYLVIYDKLLFNSNTIYKLIFSPIMMFLSAIG
ncbi:MAG: hypothetical protein RLZZ64_135, partial [Bacteroidota bacterium]